LNKQKLSMSGIVPTTWNPVDARGQKPVWVLYVVSALWAAIGILLIVMGSIGLAKKRAETRARDIGLVAGGAAVMLLLGGILLAMMFLPGYPLSKYKSYKQCLSLAAG